LHRLPPNLDDFKKGRLLSSTNTGISDQQRQSELLKITVVCDDTTQQTALVEETGLCEEDRILILKNLHEV